MNDEKRSLDERGFPHVTKETVCMFGETVGIVPDEILQPIPTDSVAAAISEDVTYRIREVAYNSKQFMKHSKRLCLRAKDFNDALSWSDVEKVHGHSNPQKPYFLHAKETDIYVHSDNNVDLPSLSLNEVPAAQFSLPQLRPNWVIVDGAVDANVSKIKINDATCDIASKYCEELCKSLFNDENNDLKYFLDDLRTNVNVNLILPYLIDLFSMTVKKLSHDLQPIFRLLYIIDSFCSNQYTFLSLKPYLDMLISSLLCCILETHPLLSNACDNHWVMRDYAARLLAQVINDNSTSMNQLKVLVENVLQEWLIDPNVQFCSYYGAISVLTYLGPGSIEYGIFPHLKVLWNSFNRVSLSSSTTVSQNLKCDMMKVQGILLHACEILLINKSFQIIRANDKDIVTPCHPSLSSVVIKADCDPDFMLPLPTKSQCSASNMLQKTKMRKLVVCKPRTPLQIHTLYTELYEYFGDRLSMRLPFIQSNVYKTKVEKLCSLFNPPEVSMTGDEILNSFYEKEEEMRSNNSVDEEHSYDDNSLLSDEQDDRELCIKDTVSDPNLGIKLIITKMPKSRQSSSPDSPKNAKRKKLNLKISKDGMEMSDEESHFLKPIVGPINRPIHILFEGSSPVPVEELKRRKFGLEMKTPADSHLKFTPQKLKLNGPQKMKAKSSNSWKRALYSSCLSYTL